VGCFEGHGLPKESQQPGEPGKILREGSGRDLPGDGVCVCVCVCVVTEEWLEHLKACIKAESGHFE